MKTTLSLAPLVSLIATLCLAGALPADPGDLDPSFQDNGRFDFAWSNGPIGPMAVGADGTVLVNSAGPYTDNGFFAITSDIVALVPIEDEGGVAPLFLSGAIEALAGGGYVIATTAPDPRNRDRNCVLVQKLTAKMHLDASYSFDGKAWGYCTTQSLTVADVAVGALGAVYVVGEAETLTNPQGGAFLDTFAPGGASHHFHEDLFLPRQSAKHGLTSIAVKPEGSGETLWVAGWVVQDDASGNPREYWLAARLDTYGEYAPGFAGLRVFGPAAREARIALGPGGKAYLAGAGMDAVVRLQPDGSNDVDFGLFGFILVTFGDGDQSTVHDLLYVPGAPGQPARLYVLGAIEPLEIEEIALGAVRALTVDGAAVPEFGYLGNGTVLLTGALPAEQFVMRSVQVRGGLAVRGTHLVAGYSFFYGNDPFNQHAGSLFRLER